MQSSRGNPDSGVRNVAALSTLSESLINHPTYNCMNFNYATNNAFLFMLIECVTGDFKVSEYKDQPSPPSIVTIIFLYFSVSTSLLFTIDYEK